MIKMKNNKLLIKNIKTKSTFFTIEEEVAKKRLTGRKQCNKFKHYKTGTNYIITNRTGS